MERDLCSGVLAPDVEHEHGSDEYEGHHQDGHWTTGITPKPLIFSINIIIKTCTVEKLR